MHTSPVLTLPVSYSVISSQALQQELLAFYPHSGQVKVLFLYQGMHDTYLVQDTSVTYVLRIYRAGWKTFEQVEAELQVLLFLHAQGLSVSFPIADKQGIFIHRIISPEGERLAVLFSYAAGEKLSSLSPREASLFGSYMAQMHQITQGEHVSHLQRNYSVTSILDGTRQAIQTILPTYLDVYRKLEQIFEILTRQLTPIVRKELKTGICHGDPHYENIFIEPGTDKVTMFDFDFSGNGFLLYDIGSFCFYERHQKNNITSFLESYSQLLPLTSLELELVPYFTLLMRLFHLGARSKNADGIKTPLWFPDEIVAKICEIEREAQRLHIVK
ncbi:phosphotransferase [Rhodocytophaga rosea]|uniref:Phosphotransferase n=1 Tax=Rhodocytophaga rosea TaxID=2704465 RepID=A0A6C0GC82_9BACT|nr:phosphotransferase [Rhodocytophaga rosea]QHT65561.1 phosphotransferase [Rhodocytophaga rosea]